MTADEYYQASLKMQYATYRLLALAQPINPRDPYGETRAAINKWLDAEIGKLPGALACLNLEPLPSSTPVPGADKGKDKQK